VTEILRMEGKHRPCSSAGLHETCMAMQPYGWCDMDNMGTNACTRHAWPHNLMAGVCSATARSSSSSDDDDDELIIIIIIIISRHHLQRGSCAFERILGYSFCNSRTAVGA
jgi:hypothetical protein